MLRQLAMMLLLGTLPCLQGCTVYGERPVRAIADATGGAGFERALWRDIKERDWKDLDRHIASNFVLVTPAGRLERPAALERLHSMRVLEYSIGELESEMNGNTFVVTYTIVLRDDDGNGQGLPDQPQRRMTVWQQQKSSWVAIAHSVLETERR
jgi:hypothetical protein